MERKIKIITTVVEKTNEETGLVNVIKLLKWKLILVDQEKAEQKSSKIITTNLPIPNENKFVTVDKLTSTDLAEWIGSLHNLDELENQILNESKANNIYFFTIKDKSNAEEIN
jgi:hypothetical protein